MSARLDFQEINQAALLSLDAIVGRYMADARRSGNWLVGRSPVRGDRHPSFGIHRRSGAWRDFATGDRGGDPISLVAFVEGVSQGEAARRLAVELGVSGYGSTVGLGQERPRTPAKAAKPAKADGRETAFVLALLARAEPANDLIRTYLASRGLSGPVPSTLRFLKSCFHKASGTRHPAMVGTVERVGTDGAVGAHRTFLLESGRGKAPVEPNKMALGIIGGGAVRLAPAGPHLLVAEGIESGLSAQTASGLPCWAALSTSGLRGLILPPLPLASVVTVAADGDLPGVAAAHAAAERWTHEGRQVRIAVPPAGSDFNDLLREIAL